MSEKQRGKKVVESLVLELNVMYNELVTGLATYPLLFAEAGVKKRVCHVSTW